MKSTPIVMTSVRLPAELHQQLRTVAFQHRRSIHSLLIEGTKAIADQYASQPPQRRPFTGSDVQRDHAPL